MPGEVSPGSVQAALYVQGLRYHSRSASGKRGGGEMSVEFGGAKPFWFLGFCLLFGDFICGLIVAL